MDSQFFQLGDQDNGDVKLKIMCSNGRPYHGNPIYLHSQVLKKSSYFEARLSERWSPDSSSSREIILNIPPDGSPVNCIDCIRLMYSSQWERQLSFSNVDDALRILPAALELLFEEGIRASLEYLEAVWWTPEQKLRIRALLSSFQVNISTDLAERLKVSKPLFNEELERLEKTVPKMLSEILNKSSVPCGLPLEHMQVSVKEQIIAYFQEDIHPALQKVCRDCLLNEFRRRLEGIKCGSSTEIRVSACESLLWLLDLIKLCKMDVFKAAFTIFVEDEDIAEILVKPQISWPHISPYYTGYNNNFSNSDRSYSSCVLEILFDKFLDALANGGIVIPKAARVSFLTKWVPVIAYLICRCACAHTYASEDQCSFGSGLRFSKGFQGGVSKILASLPHRNQKQILNSLAESAERFQTWERRIFLWWIKMISIAVVAENGSHLQIE